MAEFSAKFKERFLSLTMKKVILSSFVVISFIFYSLTEQILGAGKPNTAGMVNNPVPTKKVTPSTAVVSGLKNGQFSGDSVDAFYGNVQVQTTIQNGKISQVQFLDYPKDRNHSVEINSQAMPQLISEAITAQGANVDIVSGATATSQAFIQSLQTALNQATN